MYDILEENFSNKLQKNKKISRRSKTMGYGCNDRVKTQIEKKVDVIKKLELYVAIKYRYIIYF